MELSDVNYEQVQMYSKLIRKISAKLMRENETQTNREKQEFIIWPLMDHKHI